jgi:hypothetical protein
LEFDGTGFSAMIRNGQKIAFPFFEELANAFLLNTSMPAVAPRGMTVADDGLIYINVKEPGINSQRSLGGIWCLDPVSGRLYSKYSLGHESDTNFLNFGYQIVSSPGAIKTTNSTGSNFTNNSYLVVGAAVEGAVGSNVNRIWALSRNAGSTVGRGFFITQFIPTENIKDVWDGIWTKFSTFKSASDKIVIKARGVNALLDSTKKPLQKTITWTSTTTFTVTLGASDDALAVGDEVEIVGGRNAGVLAHITTISGSHAALQTITIDETVTAGSSTSYARFDRWKKCGVIDDNTKYAVPLNIGITSSFIQLKVELRGPATDFNIKSLIAYTKKQVGSQK